MQPAQSDFSWVSPPQAFGTTDIARELDNYVRRQDFKEYRFKFSDKLASFDAAATKMSRADAEAFLADYLVRQQRSTKPPNA